jgi:DNA-binding transcriptional LysR family regulator
MLAEGHQRRIVATVPGMAALAAFVRGSAWLATAPSLLAQGSLADLAMAELPLAAPPLRMYAVWHARHQHDPVMSWVRRELDGVVDEVLQRRPSAPARAWERVKT